jgi:hypothetical protein
VFISIVLGDVLSVVHCWATTVPYTLLLAAVPQRSPSVLSRQLVPLVNFLDHIRTLPVMLTMMIMMMIMIIIIICTVTNYVTYH